jgi:hypothetical protein
MLSVSAGGGYGRNTCRRRILSKRLERIGFSFFSEF